VPEPVLGPGGGGHVDRHVHRDLAQAATDPFGPDLPGAQQPLRDPLARRLREEAEPGACRAHLRLTDQLVEGGVGERVVRWRAVHDQDLAGPDRHPLGEHQLGQ
jgi:hypothetical protein